MARTDQWGVGSEADAKAFDTAVVNGKEVELFFGEHPHSRQDNNIYARWPDGRIEEFSGHRRPVEIEIRESNYMKESEISGDEVRMGGSYVIKIAGVEVWGEFCRTWESALRHIQTVLPKLLEHSVDWTREDSWRGRKVYYDRTPATITMFMGDQGACLVVAEPGHRFPAPVYELEHDGSWINEGERTEIKDSILSDHFWWFRKETR